MPENGDKRLFLLDAYALIFRAYFSLIRQPRINSRRLNTSAAYGFTNALLDLIQREKPSHMAVVFDTAAPTERHVEHVEYKANRQETPDDIRSNVPYIRRIIEAFNIPVIESDGYEADDVIGTLAKKAEKEGYITYMVTPDKDFGQLVSENIKMYKPGKQGAPPEVMGPKEVCERWGGLKSPEQVKDILGLMGDAVDNIPGIPGVGEKTAMKLVQQFGSLEGVIDHVDELKGKQQENVRQFADQGRLSKKLATILVDAPVELDHAALHLDPPDKDKVLEVFSELEFRTLAKRVLGDEGQLQTSTAQADLFGPRQIPDGEEPAELADLSTIATVKHKYHLVNTREGMYMLAAQLKKQKAFCFDTETTGLDERHAELVGMAFSWKEHTGHYVVVPEDQKEAQEVVNIFKPVLEDASQQKVAQNLKYDMQVMRHYGVEVKGALFDTMIAHYLLQPELRHNMDYLAETYLKYRPVSIETLIGPKNKPLRTMREADVNEVKEYSAEDADITWQLKDVFAPRLGKDGMQKLFEEVEMPLVGVLAEMEWEGIRVDVDALKGLSKELHEDLVKLDEKIIDLCGVRFNIDSPRQLGDILFDKLKISESAKRTRTGQYTTSEDVLSGLVHAHPVVPLILDYRALKKLKSTYVDALPRTVDPGTGRVHSNFRQAVAATGRLASDEPNLQNIPIRTERGREIRKAFVPRDEHYKLLSADYSQIELRVIAHMSGDKNLRDAFHHGLDIHAATAAKVFNVDIAGVTREQRGRAKAVNFGLAYGQGAFGLSQNLGIPRAEAKQIIDDYFAQFPGVRGYMDEQIAFCRAHGYVRTPLGRRRYLPDINSGNQTVRAHAERIAINAPMQGTAADIIKVAMVRIHDRIFGEKLRSRMLLTVHDELVFDVHETEEKELVELVRKEMEGAMDLEVPLVVDIHVGNNWLEAH